MADSPQTVIAALAEGFSTTSLLVTIITPPDPFRTAFLAVRILGIPIIGNPSTVGARSDLAVLGALLLRRLVPQAGACGLCFLTWRGANGGVAGIFVPPETKDV